MNARRAPLLLLPLLAVVAFVLWSDADDAPNPAADAESRPENLDATARALLEGRAPEGGAVDAAGAGAQAKGRKTITIFGTYRRGDKPVPNTDVSLTWSSPQLPQGAATGLMGEVRRTDADGAYAFEVWEHTTYYLRVGKLRVEALKPFPCMSVRVDGSEERVELNLRASGAELQVDVRDIRSGRPVPGVTVSLNSDWRGKPGASLTTNASGIAVFPDAPHNDWIVLASAPFYQGAFRRIAIKEPGRHRVTIEIEAVGSLTLRLRDDSGSFVKIPAALFLAMRHVASSRDFGSQHDGRSEWRDSKGPLELTFPALPGGRYLLSTRGGKRNRPIDPVTDHEIIVRDHEKQRLELPVRYRAFVRLAGARSDGTFDASLRLRMRLPSQDGEPGEIVAPWERQTQETNAKGDAHFEGYLAPGIYEVELTRADGKQWTERLVVEREVIEHTFTAPWPD